ncbi:hypothetical protein T492DRAFT_953266 [Pavlovales sp. CCMP2436]|nr:hypothetical protein T492DRAFT_953266 [Pavlovales sp. CCMP2436]
MRPTLGTSMRHLSIGWTQLLFAALLASYADGFTRAAVVRRARPRALLMLKSSKQVDASPSPTPQASNIVGAKLSDTVAIARLAKLSDKAAIAGQRAILIDAQLTADMAAANVAAKLSDKAAIAGKRAKLIDAQRVADAAASNTAAIVDKLDELLAATKASRAATLRADKHARKAALQAAMRWAMDNAEMGEFEYTDGDEPVGSTAIPVTSGDVMRDVLFDLHGGFVFSFAPPFHFIEEEGWANLSSNEKFTRRSEGEAAFRRLFAQQFKQLLGPVGADLSMELRRKYEKYDGEYVLSLTGYTDID